MLVHAGPPAATDMTIKALLFASLSPDDFSYYAANISYNLGLLECLRYSITAGIAKWQSIFYSFTILNMLEDVLASISFNCNSNSTLEGVDP